MFAFLLGADARLPAMMLGVVAFRRLREIDVAVCVPLVFAPGIPANSNDRAVRR